MNNVELSQWCSEFILKKKFKAPLIMGVLNTTPDSFSDGGLYKSVDCAIIHALRMIKEGADIIDIGGESSRPGALPVDSSEELKRVIPVIKKLRSQSDICISIDTTKAVVMLEAVEAGASMVNDITALAGIDAAKTIADLDVPVCLMHMQGVPENMQKSPYYQNDIVEDINLFFQQRILFCLHAGIKRQNLILDPGFGFGKLLQHNMQIVKSIKKFLKHNLPILVGVSRKSSIGEILQQPVNKRLIGGLTLATFLALEGAAIIRTHDVYETKQAFTILAAISN